tara:strand:- start:981 stop:1427 length:447 start_codon:yes stop_codon:yes gene_type:complete
MKLDKELLRTIIKEQIDEMCGVQQQSIDMGVQKHHDDHEGNMAKRQMFKTAQYAVEIFDNIHDDDVFPSWIQSKMTKIADYIGVVKHYLEYDHVMGERKLTDAESEEKEKLAKKYKPAMDSFKDQYGDEGKSVYYATMTKKAKKGEKA